MKLYVIALLGISLVLFSCKKDPKRGVPPSEQVVKDLNKTDTKVTVKFADSKQELLYNDYLSVKAALVNTDASKTQVAAKKMAADFADAPAYNGARQVAVLISKEKDVEKQREFFVGLTSEVFAAINTGITEGKVFQQMCPMAFNGKGAVWLSDSKEVRNPYFGDVMLACGAVMKVFEKQ